MQLRANDPKTNENAKRVKTQSCLHASGPQGFTCERAACRQACATLQDQSCLFQLDNGERNFPAKF
ncbi:MAG: serine/threonine protein kinase [Labilithrix sp.]|nr:serine/threonine protein kinase [Labilithrix sp.]